jgi:recombination protein RecT
VTGDHTTRQRFRPEVFDKTRAKSKQLKHHRIMSSQEVATSQNNVPAVAKTISDFLSAEKVNKKIEEILGDSKREFVASVIGLYNSSKDIQECTMPSIVNACLMAAAFKLPISNALGFVYVYGFNNRQKDNTYKKEATFMLGYKGIKQLCARSGQFAQMNEVPIYAGQMKAFNPLKGEFEFDFTIPAKGEPIAYAAYFRLLNGFEKLVVMNTAQVIEHAKRHSPTYGKKKKDGTPVKSTWDSDFEAMALKTVSKRCLTKGEAPMSIEMQNAFIADGKVIKEAGKENFVAEDLDLGNTEDAAHEEIKPDQIENKPKDQAGNENAGNGEDFSQM